MGPRLGNVPTPLEIGDTVLDTASQVVSVVPRVVGNVTGAISQTAKNLEGDLARPRDYSEIPPPPDMIVSTAFDGVGHVIGGVLDTVKGGIDGVVGTIDGVKREIDQLIRR